MRICFPVQTDEGLESAVYNHFGSAPQFVVVDTDTKAVAAINNRDQHHAHGSCSPAKALDGRQIDAVVVGGIGAGALAGLNSMGIVVHRAQAASIRENMELYASRSLPILTPAGCCGGHSHGGGCAH